jgi:lipoprotein-releasing system ATP-binding protein
MSETHPLIVTTGLGRTYALAAGPLEVLRGVDLRIASGESLAIVGPSGSGKSTLLHLIGGLDTPSTGAVHIDGFDLARLTADQLAAFRAREVGFVFQSHHLLPQLTLLENVLLPTLAADGAHSAVDRAQRLLNRVGLAQRLDHRPGQLSGGECQRVAVVRALVNSPRVLLADEPTGALDHAAADTIGTLLAEIGRDEKVTLVVVTHSPELARKFGRVLELRDGRLV